MKFTPKYYPCSACGAVMLYSPKKEKLYCYYCNSEKTILKKREIKTHPVSEFNSGYLLPNSPQPRELNCPKCGAGYSMEPFQVSTICPYCSTPAITDFLNPIKPESITPFRIEQKDAHKIFGKWIGSLWFAPNELKKLVDIQKKMVGFYLPYWLFDAETETYYSGERGDAYYVSVERRVVTEDGREKIVIEQERRVRWTPVSGRVSRKFIDISVPGSDEVPISLLKSFKNINSKSLVSFNSEFVSGFDTREYKIEPKISYQEAISKMRIVIRRDVIFDIGGDEQRIYSIDTKYFDEVYKHTLFPIWSTKFKYRGKYYYYAIDGLSGEIVGERPYSYWKISIIVLIITFILAIIVYWEEIELFFKHK